MAFNEDFLQELKYKVDIEDVISSYVTLKRRGSTLTGFCPFHNEKTPSFTVYPDTQSFYCFGCGAGGDAVTFVKKIENLDYADAVKSLAQRAGIAMPQDNYDDSLSKKRRRVLEANREAAKFFYEVLIGEKGKIGLNYYLNRGLTIHTIKKFGLGYAPDSWDSLLKHLKEKGFTISEMISAGLIKQGQKGYYDIFRNRVMTPIIDIRGNVIAFGGRVLDDSKPKYINTSDTLVYKKTNELFAMNFAKDSGEDSLILCEGYMDVIAMHQAGFKNAVAGCGTALTNEQVRLISRYAKEVILTYDADEAGQKALNKAIYLFNQTDLKVKIPTLSGGKDPDEIIKKFGRDKFKGMLEGASNEVEFQMLAVRNKVNIKTTQGKIDFLKECIKILSPVSPIEQDLYISRLAEELMVSKQSIKLQLDDYTKRQKYNSKKKEYTKIFNDSIRDTNKRSYTNGISIRQSKAEDRLLGLLLLYPDCYDICGDFDKEHLSDFSKNIYSILTKRLDEHLDIDMLSLGNVLSTEEISRISGIIARTGSSIDSKAEFEDCLNAINDEQKSKKDESFDNISDDDFRSLFKSKNT